MGNIRAFIFDLDGVITDTSEFHFRAWQRLAGEEGLHFTRQENEALRGVGRRESLNLVLKAKKIPEATAEAWMERKNNYYLEMVKNMSPGDLLLGAEQILKELRLAGFKVAVASSSKNARLVIQRLGLGDSLDALVDGTMVANSKPAPDLFIKAAELLGVSPLQCVVVEDASAGIEAGKAAGMLTLGLGPVERVGRASLVLPDLQDAHLADILQRLENKTGRSPELS